MRIIINKHPYDLVYQDAIIMDDGSVLTGLVDHSNKTVKISTSHGRRSEREMLDTLLHECSHALIRQNSDVVNAKEGVVVEWIGFYIGRLLYDNPELFRSYLRLDNKKRVPYLAPVS